MIYEPGPVLGSVRTRMARTMNVGGALQVTANSITTIP